jgi:hypothetical protein
MHGNILLLIMPKTAKPRLIVLLLLRRTGFFALVRAEILLLEGGTDELGSEVTVSLVDGEGDARVD